MKLYCSWNSLKEIKIKVNLIFYYYDNPYYYEILVVDGNTSWFTEIWKDTNQCAGLNIEENNINLLDFQDNYKFTAQKL